MVDGRECGGAGPFSKDSEDQAARVRWGGGCQEGKW